MKKRKLLLLLSSLLIGTLAYADEYTISYELSSITITEPGTHTINGEGNTSIYIGKEEDNTSDAVYNIILDNMSLTPQDWASAIIMYNKAPGGTMTVNFIIEGTNYVEGDNHGGIKTTIGDINIVFSTTSAGVITSTANRDGNYAFQEEPEGTFNVSIAPNISATATLAGESMSVETALQEAFSKKPLVLSLSIDETSVNTPSADELFRLSGNEITIANGSAQIEIFDIAGHLVLQRHTDRVALPQTGIYIVKINGTPKKIVIQ